MAKVIISCAVTGAIHTPSMSDYLPITPEEIAEQSIAAAEAGAAIIHLHARDPDDGRPTPDPAVFMQFLPVIKQSTDAVINITTGGGLGMTLDERLAAPLQAKPEMCSLNMGSMNFNISGPRDRIKKLKHEWEKPYLEGTDDFIFRNTFKDIERIVETLGKGHGTRFEFECYDVGHLYNLAYMLDRKIVEPPLFVQSIFGILGGIGAEPRNLLFMKETADRLFGKDYVWSVLAAGRHQMPFTTMAGILGGNVRVGLEDSLCSARASWRSRMPSRWRRSAASWRSSAWRSPRPAEARRDAGAEGRRTGRVLREGGGGGPAARRRVQLPNSRSSRCRISRASKPAGGLASGPVGSRVAWRAKRASASRVLASRSSVGSVVALPAPDADHPDQCPVGGSSSASARAASSALGRR